MEYAMRASMAAGRGGAQKSSARKGAADDEAVDDAGIGGCLALAIVAGCGQSVPPAAGTADGILADGIPAFEYDPTWPKPLPNNWVTGNIGAMTIDSQKHIWVAQRPGSTLNLSERYGLEDQGECCFPAPPIMEFDPEGNLIQAWGPIHDDQGELLGDQVLGAASRGRLAAVRARHLR